MTETGPTDAEVVEAAAAAAEDVIFSRIEPGEVEDIDVSVSFVDGQLDVAVYLLAPAAVPDTQRVADEAVAAARTAADDLLA